MRARPTVLLFDIDGTLITCGGAGRAAMEAAFREHIGAPEVPHFRFAGGTDRAIARRYFAEAGSTASDRDIETLLETYLRHLPGALAAAEGYRVFAGATEVLDRLEGLEGYAIGLGTGNIEAGARTKLRHGGLDARFAFGGFGSDHEERPRLIEAGARRGAAQLGVSLEACRVVVIGDTVRDVHAAKAIGAECVGVATGHDDAATLRDAGAAHVFEGLHALGLHDVLLPTG